ncbi:MAG: hypothetical protein ACTH07_07165, partial [Microbacterium sp.]
DPLSSSVSVSLMVWAVPWTGVAVVALVAGLVCLVLWRRRRARVAREEEEWINDSDRMNAEYAADDQIRSGATGDMRGAREDELA